jgi:predicted  nucleic acid-binding Zn-ribbon protein
MAITKEQIFAAADELDAGGQSPTLSAVRKAVGGGSFTTISEAMTEWKARRAAKEAPASEPVPDAVADRLEAATRDLWAAAVELATSRLHGERERMDDARRILEASQHEAAELANQLAGELEIAKARNLELEAAARNAQAEADDLRRQIASAAERIVLADARVAEIEKRVADLNRELERAHGQNAELMKVVSTKGKTQR